MADVNKDRFSERLKTIEKKTKPGTRIHQRVTADGLVVDVVKKDRRGLIPYKAILTLIVLFVIFKGFLFARLGEAEYLDRVDQLKQGEAVEVSVAFLLDADPATRFIANWVAKLFQ